MNYDFKINGRKIETERLLLRPWKKTDVDDLYEYASVDGVGERAGWNHHESKEESARIVDMFIEDDVVFAICLKESGKVIGSLGVERYGLEDKLSEFFDYSGRELGFVLGRDYWGKGYVPEAAGAVIDFLFNECGLDFLICGYFERNSQSKRAQEKLGFKPYRKLEFNTRRGVTEKGVINLLLNPKKDIKLVFSHPETLIYEG